MISRTFQPERHVRRLAVLLRPGLALLVCLFAAAMVSAQNQPPAGTVHRITLEEAKQAAASGQNPLVRLGRLQAEAASQNRKIFQSQYLPQISGTFANLHFNKFMGEEFQIRRPILGTTVPAWIPLFSKDVTAVLFNVTQPLTPLFKVREAVKIARADENIAKAKAGIPIIEAARNVEKGFFDLLIAQRELVVATAKSRKVQNKLVTASTSPAPALSAEQEAEIIDAEKTVLLATSKVQELTASLCVMVGLPIGTELEPVPPAPEGETVSLDDATRKAMTFNPEVVEAEQTALKARAGRRLARLDYVPDLAIVGGYSNQNLMPALPRDFSYIGVMATFTIFDFGKREHTVKQRDAQVEAAELGVELTKAKVAGAVKTSYFEMQRSRALIQLSQRALSQSRVLNVSYQAGSAEVTDARAALEADMFRAELAYREALGRLKTLMGDR